MSNASGFDMTMTIAWYLIHETELLDRLPAPHPDLSILSASGIEIHREAECMSVLTDGDIAALMGLFPESARARWNVTKITTRGPRWFHRDSLNGTPAATEDSAMALSPTAIVPSYVGHNKWDKPPGFDSRIELYAMDLDVVPINIQRIIHAEALVHELAHGVVTSELYGHNNRVLQLTKSTTSPYDHLLSMIDVLKSTGPISHYASAYLDSDNEFPDDADAVMRGINENTVEVIAAILLGFAFQPASDGLFPFDGEKAGLLEHVEPYLNAALVS